MIQRVDRGLRLTLVVYAAASLLHFVHNAVYLSAYPNMPRWLTPAGVYMSWLGMTALGLLGYAIYRFRSRSVGTVLIATYALLGFGGLDHYAVAPIAAHSIVMNITIAAEAAAAMALLLEVSLGHKVRRA